MELSCSSFVVFFFPWELAVLVVLMWEFGPRAISSHYSLVWVSSHVALSFFCHPFVYTLRICKLAQGRGLTVFLLASWCPTYKQPFDYYAGWLIVSGEPGEAEVQEEDHDVSQTEVADGDIMDGEAETDSVVIAGQPEVLSSQEMQVGRQIIPAIFRCGAEPNPQVVWVGEYFRSLPQ